MKRSVIIVAGGSGKRMNAVIPKQFMLLNGKPVLMHSIERFYNYDSSMSIVVVLPESEVKEWNKLISNQAFSIKHDIVIGGATRFESVQNGLSKITEHCIVAIHDGVRPLCSSMLINRCFEDAVKYSNAIPSIPVSDSIRIVEGEKNRIADRDSLRIIQTPQCFDSVMIKKAYLNNEAAQCTDDAGVFELDGNTVHLTQGERFNIKITVPEDLKIVEAILKINQ